jgi:hypothetical protein
MVQPQTGAAREVVNEPALHEELEPVAEVQHRRASFLRECAGNGEAKNKTGEGK